MQPYRFYHQILSFRDGQIKAHSQTLSYTHSQEQNSGFLIPIFPCRVFPTVLCHFQKHNNINDNSTSFSPIGESEQEAVIMDYLFGVAGHGDSHQASAPGI